jgi:signal transduction histidine kinase
MQEAVQTLQLHDTELTRDVLLARAGRLAHYDALPRTGQRLGQALGALRAESATVAGPAATAIRQHVEALTAALHQKMTLLTYFTNERTGSALGLLVSGVAHEINNPNKVVLMNARVLAHAWDDVVDLLDTYARESGAFALAGLPYTEMRETIPALVHGVHEGARRIERIIGDLKDFARPRTRDADPVCQLNDAVQHALRLLAHLIKQRTDHVQVDLSQGLPPVRGDTQQVEQVVVNLLTNALEALPDRTRGMTVTTAFEAATRRVTLAVSDAGGGIRPEHLAHLCDSFFTTKHESGGTGLGLVITASLVRAHGGQLTFASEPGQGTRVLVTWLCHDPEPPLSPNISPACRETASA